MAVGHLLLKSFWANEAIFQLMMDAGLQYIFAVQDGFRKGNGIPAANQDIPLEVCFSYWEDNQIGKICSNESPRKISI